MASSIQFRRTSSQDKKYCLKNQLPKVNVYQNEKKIPTNRSSPPSGCFLLRYFQAIYQKCLHAKLCWLWPDFPSHQEGARTPAFIGVLAWVWKRPWSLVSWCGLGCCGKVVTLREMDQKNKSYWGWWKPCFSLSGEESAGEGGWYWK